MRLLFKPRCSPYIPRGLAFKKIQHSARIVHSVTCGSDNERRSLRYKTLTDFNKGD